MKKYLDKIFNRNAFQIVFLDQTIYKKGIDLNKAITYSKGIYDIATEKRSSAMLYTYKEATKLVKGMEGLFLMDIRVVHKNESIKKVYRKYL